MNLTDTPRESFFSGVEDGNGQKYVSVHDATMDHFTGLNHVANIYIIIRDKVDMATLSLIAGGGQQTSYFVLVECDGGPDHNLVHLANHIYLFALLFVENMDKLVATRGCPGLSYMNTDKLAISIINIGLSGLVL